MKEDKLQKRTRQLKKTLTVTKHLKEELEFEKQYNAELGKRNRQYIQTIENYEQNLATMFDKISQLKLELQTLAKDAEQTNTNSSSHKNNQLNTLPSESSPETSLSQQVST